MALALEDLAMSFSSPSFAVVTDSEKDLRASLATVLPPSPAAGQPWAFGAPRRGMSPVTCHTSGLDCSMSNGNSTTPSTGYTRAPPPNTPMGTPVKEDLVLSSAMSHYCIDSVSNAAPLPPSASQPFTHGLFRSPPPSPNRASFHLTEEGLPFARPSIAQVDFAQFANTCSACAYSLTLNPHVPSHLFPTPKQHACPLSSAFNPSASDPSKSFILRTCTSQQAHFASTPTTYLPSPSPSPGPTFGNASGNAASQAFEPISNRTRQRLQYSVPRTQQGSQ